MSRKSTPGNRNKPAPVRPTPDADGLFHFDKDLRLWSRQELAPYFAAESSGRILLTPLIKNIIWQAHERIQAGLEPPVLGNLRTFWYRFVKPVLAHVGADAARAQTDPYDVMLNAFVELTLERRLFRYADFDLTDENWENRRIGTTKPEVLVFAEKTGWIRFLREMHDTLGVSVLALGGAPSALTSEYTAKFIKATTPALVRLVGVVDYDPSSDIIAEAFRSQLEAVGLEVSSLTTIIHPQYYSPDELRMFRFPLPKGEKTKLAKWLTKTGGIGGEAFGLEAESMPLEKARNLIRELVLGPV